MRVLKFKKIRNSLFLHRFFLCASAFLCAFLLTSCDFLQTPEWGSPVHAWFEKYTNSAAVMQYEIPDAIGKSNTGIVCVESNEDKSVTLFLRNPQNYTLQFEYVYDIEAIATEAESYNKGWTFEQSEDRQSVTLTFSRDFLHAIDMGSIGQKNISGTIKIVEEETLRDFETFHLDLMVNSAPPRMRGAMLQRDRKKSEDDAAGSRTSQYVICFNIPKLNGTVHQRDTKDIYFAGEHYLIDFSSATPQVTDAEGNATTRFLTSQPALYNIDDSETVFSHTALNAEGYVALYYLTGVNPEASDSTVSFTVRVTDQYGFSSVTEVSNRSDKLVAPTVQVSADATYCADDDRGVYPLVISHTGQSTHKDEEGNTEAGELAQSVTIVYEVYNSSNTVVASGTKLSPVTIPVEKGSYYVKCYGVATGFIDSDTQTGFGTTSASVFTVHRSANYYVSRNGYDIWNGSKNKPYRTIQHCVDEILSSAQTDYISTGYSIIMQTDITPSEDESDFSSNGGYLVRLNKGSVSQDMRFTLNGNGHTIDAERSETQPGGAIAISDGITVTFNDVNVTGGYKRNGSPGVSVDGLGTTLNYNSGSVTGCTGSDSGISVCNRATLNLGSFTDLVTVSGNTEVETELPCAVYIDTNATLNLYKAVIYNNYDPDGNPANLYLEGGGNLETQSKVNVMSSLAGCKIGVYTACDPAVGQPVPFTTNYGYINGSNEGRAPGLYFIGDRDGVSFSEQSGEAVLAKNGGGLTPVVDEEIKIVADSMYVPFNTQKDIHISVIKTAGTEQTDVTADCSGTTFAMYYYGDALSRGTYYTSSGNTFTAKTSLRTGEYEIFVSTTYNGRTYSAQLPLAVRAMEEVYVDQTRGNDSNNGTSEHPVKTLSRAIGLINATESFGFYTICINGTVAVGGTGTATLTAQVASLSILKSGTTATVTGSSGTILKVNAPVDVSVENVTFTTSGNANAIEFDSTNGRDAKLTLKGSALVGRIKLAKENTIVLDEAYAASNTVYVHPEDDDTTDRIVIGGNITEQKLASFSCTNTGWSIDREGRLAAPLKDAPDTVGDLVLSSGKAVAYENRQKINSTQRADAIAVIFYDHNDDYDSVNNKLGDRLLGVGIGSYDGHVERYSIGEGTAAANGWFKWIGANHGYPAWSGADYSRNGAGISGDVDGSDNLAQIGAQMRAWGRTDDTGEWHYCAIQWAMYSYPNNRQYTGDWRNGWYLPTPGEYLIFWWNKDIVNNVLDYAAPNTRRFNTGDWFWTSCCPDGGADRDAIFFQWTDGKTNWEDSFREHSVCAIRNFK